MYSYYPYEAFYEGSYPYDEHDALVAKIGVVVGDLIERRAPPPPPSPVGATGAGVEYLVGWSQPPRPADVVVSFNPRASKRDQARAVLYDYYHDDPLRYWSDNEAVKRCFIGGNDPRKENHDLNTASTLFGEPQRVLLAATIDLFGIRGRSWLS
jgi:hypothetical protein